MLEEERMLHTSFFFFCNLQMLLGASKQEISSRPKMFYRHNNKTMALEMFWLFQAETLLNHVGNAAKTQKQK